MRVKTVIRVMLTLLVANMFGVSLIEPAGAQAYTVHFICETMNRGNQGAITFAGTTYYSGQSASYSAGDYWITGNPPSPTTDWFFYRWQILWIGSQSWVDNLYAKSTWFHLRGEAYLNAEFYSPIQANSPLYPTLFYGEKQRVTGSATQYYSQQLSVCYYKHGSGYGPSNPNGLPPFGCPGGAGYGWTTVTVSPYPGVWDTGLVTPTIPLFDPSYTLPMTVDVFAGWAIGSANEVDSNVVSFQIDPAPVLIAAPTLNPSTISLGESVSIEDEIFSRYFINAGDMTGTWAIQAKLEGETTWTNIASQTFTSIYDYSTVYGEAGVLHRISHSWAPPSSGTYYIRISYSGNRLYESATSLSSTLTVGQAIDLGIIPQLQHKDTQMLCLGAFADGGCSLTGDHAWDNEHLNRDCDHDNNYCVPASISMINSYFGGHLSQDRIMYYIMRELNDYRAPEYQLGHARGVNSFTGEIQNALSWALNGATIDHFLGQPSFAEIMGWIDSERPILRRETQTRDHATVIDGYEEMGSLVHVIDPWAGQENSLPYSTLDVFEVWIPPSGASARSDESELSMDLDGDGVVDFDEVNRFLTNPNNPDSDGDLVFDKQEIISYTFLADGTYDAADTRRPDAENWGFGDGFRAELDIDSDNGGTTDGLEDLNRNGLVDLGETDPLDSSDDRLQAASVRITAHSPINLLVTDPINRRVGYDPDTQSVVNEIPGATYSGPGSEPQEITIPNSLNGTYEVEAIGTAAGPYTITVESLDSNSSIIDGDSWLGNAAPNERYVETMNLEPDGRLVLPHDIEVANLAYSRTAIAKGHNVFVFVTVENQGNYTETFSVSAFANTTIIDAVDVTLPSGNYTTITFVWNTTDVAYGTYTIKTNTTIVSGEKDTIDNTRIGSTLVVTIAGDVNGDGKVDSSDLSYLGNAYGAEPSMQNWNPNCDLNYDNKPNVEDLFDMGRNYGQNTQSMETDFSKRLLPFFLQVLAVLCLLTIGTCVAAEKKEECEGDISICPGDFWWGHVDLNPEQGRYARA